MHIYIYDSFINARKYDQVLARIETRITDLGLNGKIIRLNITTSVFEYIENEIKKGAKTIIAVGNDFLLNQTINSVARLMSLNAPVQEIPVGFIPIGKKNNRIAKYLSIDFEENACDVLSARRVQKLDLGQANDCYFLTAATITSEGTTVEIDQNYSVEIMSGGEIGIINLPTNIALPNIIKTNAKDGILELYIKAGTAKKFLPISNHRCKHSIFSFKNLRIINNSQPVVIDNSVQIKSPVNISPSKEKINLIVGKNKRF